jgi:hypothetical protein
MSIKVQQPQDVVGMALRREQLRSHYVQDDPTQNAFKSDPQSQTSAWLHAHDKTARTLVGTITDSCAIAHVYRVQFEKGQHVIPCTLLSTTSHSLFGTRDLRTLQPGTTVVALVHQQYQYGIILGVLPSPQFCTGDYALADVICQASRNRVDEAHKLPLRMNANGYIPDLLAGRPFDGTTVGEWGAITETGLRIYLDPFMAMLGTGEGCNITAFYHDDLLRIAAYNLQFWTSGYERESLNDQDECCDLEGWTPYPWEQMGYFSRQNLKRELQPEDWQIGEQQPWYSEWEPKYDNQQPWHRSRVFHGYLGQGRKELQQAPPMQQSTLPNCYHGNLLQNIGLHDDFVTMSGERCIQSAKRISIVKRCAIISPQRVARPEQPGQGDTPENYRFAGLQGSGPEHTLTSGLQTTDDKAFLQRAAGILDMHAYLYNYAGFVGFYWHEKDWSVPEEHELLHTGGTTTAKLAFRQLAEQQYLEPPQPVKWDIDHRLAQQEYWQTEAGLDFLEDGGVVLYGGGGEQICFTGGQVFIDAPGDIWLKAGRNVNQWAGYDLILRAKNSADLTTTKHDIRLKAEQHVQVLAGNGGTGAVLIESRGQSQDYRYEEGGESVQASGIQLRAANADVVTWAENIYLRTGSNNGSIATGQICLDASAGQANIILNCQNHTTYSSGTIAQYFGVNGRIQSANEFSTDGARFGSQVTVGSGLVIDGNLSSRGNLYVASGHVYTETGKIDREIGALTGDLLQQIQDTCAEASDYTLQTLLQTAETDYRDIFTDFWYADYHAGNEDVLQQAEVTLRTMDEYKTQDFVLYETRWQQVARLGDGVPAKWEEALVQCTVGVSMPYPGYENFYASVYYQHTPTLYDGANGHCADRGASPQLSEAYRLAQFGASMPKQLSEYAVIHE